MENQRRILGIVCENLLIVGGINWGLIGLGGPNMVNLLFASMPFIEKGVYTLVGLSAIYILFRLIQKET